MMIKRNLAAVIVCALAVAVCGALAAAQSEPDFNGTWKMNMAKSQVGPGFHGLTSAKFERKGDTFAEELGIQMPDGEKKVSLAYKLDGKEYEGKVLGRTAKLSAKWDGDALLITWRDEVQASTIKRRLKLSADGKTIEMSLTEINLDNQHEFKIVLDRQ